MVSFLLTSAGVKNASIRRALEQLLGKSIADSHALCIPTAAYAFPNGAASAWRLVAGAASTPLTELGWASMGVLELTALTSLTEQAWLPALRDTDAILVGGGDPTYLSHWMRASGFADVLATLRPEIVYVGVSAGSMVMGPSFAGETYGCVQVQVEDPSGLGFVGFSMFPHVDHPDLPENTMAEAEIWAAAIPNPTYAVDDDTAIQVVNGEVTVITEGACRLLNA